MQVVFRIFRGLGASGHEDIGKLYKIDLKRIQIVQNWSKTKTQISLGGVLLGLDASGRHFEDPLKKF